MSTQITKNDAIDFFSKIYSGKHHIPSEVKEFGTGFQVYHRGGLPTYDFDLLTRLVIIAHDQCFRVEIMPLNPGRLRIAIWKRQRDGRMHERHPTLIQAIENIRYIS